MMGTALMPGRPIGGSSPPPGGVSPGAPGDAAAYSPPHAQQGVNPLGGTVAADGGGFAAAAAYAQQHGAQLGGPYGAPPGQAPPQYGAPPQQYGAPPQQYGAPPQQQYGAPPQYGTPGPSPSPYGAPQQQFGAPQGVHPMAPQGMMPYGGAISPSPMTGTLPSGGVAGSGPRRRNALMTFLLPFAVIFGGVVFCTILAMLISPMIGMLSMLFVLGGSAWYLIQAIQMTNEVKVVTGNQAFVWWPIIVPFFNLYWMLILVPQEVARAKQMRGVQAPVRPLIIYLFLWPYALASDLNDLAR